VHTDIFDFLCKQLGHDASTVLVIRVGPEQVSVTYTEPSGMPCSRSYRVERLLDQAA